MNTIKDKKIKIIFWDLDDTLWKGTLGEEGESRIDPIVERFEMIDVLNKRGIVSSICSKNDFDKAKSVLEKLGYWDLFIMPQIAYLPKGEMIATALKELALRPQNCLFIDDNDFNLREVEFYNEGCSVVNVNNVFFEDLLNHPALEGKDDRNLTRFKQYKQIEEKCKAKKNYSSNDKFLSESNIVVEFIEYKEELLDRLFELSDRTNQLNFTKNRMSKKELADLAKSSDVDLKMISVSDNFGDYGIVGFYALKNKQLIHFVFSCRIMNMKIENFVYAYLNHPSINIVGDVASNINNDDIMPKFIKLRTDTAAVDDSVNIDSIDLIIDDSTELNIYGLGACDLYHPIAFFAMPNNNFNYECNVFNGTERGVNVGTEYIRSVVEMSAEDKEYCKKHFNNYTGQLAFNTALFKKEWDYIILSFHDDQVYNIYRSKKDSTLRVLLSPGREYGDTSIIGIGSDGETFEGQKKWLKNHFTEGEYITPDRFYENIKWIASRVNESAKILLVTGPELDFFRDNNPSCPVVRNQILKLNKVLWDLEREAPDKFAVVDINKVIKSKADVTNYIYHLKADTAYKLFVEITRTIINRFPSTKNSMLHSVINGRELVIFGNNMEARNAFYNLSLGKEFPKQYVHFNYQGKTVGAMSVNSCEDIVEKKNKYYVVIADSENYLEIRNWLIENGYVPIKDFVYLKPRKYHKVWNEK